MKESSSGRYQLPPQPKRDSSDYRRVGFELEFSGITLDRTVAAIESSLGAQIGAQTAADTRLEVEGLGEFIVELDWEFLKRKAAENGEDTEGREWLDLLSQAASMLVPVEVVCPPIAMNRLEALDPMIEALRQAGAMGTEESLLAAYGVHINTEIPALDAATLFDYLRSFAALQWWLVDAHEVDPTRKLSPYIDLYPEAYLHQLLSQTKATMEQIFDNYLEHNATRNRALDLLPLLAEIDSEKLRGVVDDPRVKARPAFHYRMPNCDIDKVDWSLVEVWQPWLVVERLAHDSKLLDQLGRAFIDAQRPVIGVSRSAWVEFIDQWLSDHALV